jgi:hypothetical protein
MRTHFIILLICSIIAIIITIIFMTSQIRECKTTLTETRRQIAKIISDCKDTNTGKQILLNMSNKELVTNEKVLVDAQKKLVDTQSRLAQCNTWYKAHVKESPN